MRENADRPTRHRLSELVGQTITLANEPVREVSTKVGTAHVATLSDGSEVYLPDHVVEQLEEPIAGKYLVYSFPSKTGKVGYSLRNAYTG